LRGGWRWPRHHESETLRRWLLRARAAAGCRAGVAVGGSVCIPRGDRQGAHSCGGAGWWGRHRGRHGSSRQVAPPQWGFRRWASTRPVSRPDRQAATEPPGSYPDGTHARWRRRAYVGFSYSIPPATLGARTIRASLWTAFPSGRGRSGRGLGAAPFGWWRGRLLEE
jgi:hypothetical protein